MINKPSKKQHYNQKFLNDVESTLQSMRLRLQEDLGRFSNKTTAGTEDYEAKFPEYGNEEDDNAREIADYTANKPLEITLEKELRDVEKSLERLKKGTYGTCKYCDQPIDEKRLLARPTSSSCVSCKKTLTEEA